MCDGHVGIYGLIVFAPEFPHQIAVYGGEGVIDGHAEVGVQSVLPEEHDVEGGHDDTHEPQGDAGTIFEQDVEQTKQGGHDVEPMGGDEIKHFLIENW